MKEIHYILLFLNSFNENFDKKKRTHQWYVSVQGCEDSMTRFHKNGKEHIPLPKRFTAFQKMAKMFWTTNETQDFLISLSSQLILSFGNRSQYAKGKQACTGAPRCKERKEKTT
jgi:hypothetical protein